MPRIARKNIKSHYIHVVIQGIEKRFIFQENESKKYYLELLYKNLKDYPNMYILAYCIMDNHIHLLFYCKNIEELSKLMSRTNTSYALWYNKLEKRVGYVYRDRYYTQAIKDEKHLLNSLAYIHNNPVKAGMVKNAKEYSYSSYNLYKNYKMEESIIRLLFQSKEYMEQFDYIHKNFKEDDILEVKSENASKEELEKIITEFSNKNQIKLDIIKKNNYFLILLIKEIKEKANATNKEIFEHLKIGKNRIRNLLKREENLNKD